MASAVGVSVVFNNHLRLQLLGLGRALLILVPSLLLVCIYLMHHVVDGVHLPTILGQLPVYFFLYFRFPIGIFVGLSMGGASSKLFIGNGLAWSQGICMLIL